MYAWSIELAASALRRAILASPITYSTALRSHQLNRRVRQNPESVRILIEIFDQACHNRRTNSLNTAAACYAPSMLDGRR